MDIDYEKEYISLLEKNKISTLPPQYIIDNNEKVAHLIWKNYELRSEDYEYSSSYIADRYNKGNFKDVFQAYNLKFDFWENIFGINDSNSKNNDPSKYIYKKIYKLKAFAELLIETDFIKDFPDFTNHHLSDNENIKRLFEVSNSDYFFDRLKMSTEEKNEYYKSYLLKKKQCNSSDFIKFQDDRVFTKNILDLVPELYRYLSDENKEDKEYIKVALKFKDNFFHLPENKKGLLFEKWLEMFLFKLQKKDLVKFKPQQIFQICEERLDLLEIMIGEKSAKYKQHGLQILLNKPGQTIEEFRLQTLQTLIESIKGQQDLSELHNDSNNLYDFSKLKQTLEIFVDNFHSLTDSTSMEKKYIYLISKFADLQEKLGENLFLQVRDNYDRNKDGKKITLSIFETIIDKTIELYQDNKIDTAKANDIISKSKPFLSVEDLRQLKIPKGNPFEFVKAIRLNEKLKDSLHINEIPKKMVKI